MGRVKYFKDFISPCISMNDDFGGKANTKRFLINVFYDQVPATVPVLIQNSFIFHT